MKWLERIGIAVGIWFWSAVACIFFGSHSQFLSTYALWSCRLFAGAVVLMFVGVVVFCIGFGAVQAIKMYREAIEATKMGILGRVVLAIWFIISFLIALCFIRL